MFAASGLYLFAAIGLLILSFLSPYLARGLFHAFPEITTEQTTLVVNAFYYLPFMFLPFIVWAVRQRHAVASLRLNPISPLQTVLIFLSAPIGVLIAINLTFIWTALMQHLGLNVVQNNYVRPTDASELVRSVLSTALLAAVGEELLFRGVLFSAWEQWGTTRAMWTTAVMFALLHGSILGFPAEVLGGLAMAYMVFATGSLYAGIIFHAVYNASTVLLNYATSGLRSETIDMQPLDLFATLGTIGLIQLAIQTAFLLLIFSTVLKILQGYRLAAEIVPLPSQRVPLSKCTYLMLAAAGILIVLFYGADLLRMLGG